MSAAEDASAAFGEWAQLFRDTPVTALRALLSGSASLGSASAIDPDDLLTAWIQGSDDEGLGTRVDESLAILISETWGSRIGPTKSARRTAIFWQTLCNAVAYMPNAEQASGALWDRLESCDEYLGSLTTAPSNDPLGRYYFALARNQRDRGLAPLWWSLVRLTPGIRHFHGAYGIYGIRGLPPENDQERGRFRNDVAIAVAELCTSLAGLAEAGELSQTAAEREFLAIGRLTVAAYPFPSRWVTIDAIDASNSSELARRWWSRIVPAAHARSRPSVPRTTRDQRWSHEAQSVSRDLRTGSALARPRANALLATQRVYAAHSGDVAPVALTLTNFANSALGAGQPDLALSWAQEAVAWSPWDHYPWNLNARALLAARGAESALAVAIAAANRFPENSAQQNFLGHVLMRGRRLDEAEAAYRFSRFWFPEDPHAWGGLAEVHKHKSNLAEASTIYREGLDKFPDNDVLKIGLAGVLRLIGPTSLGEAESLIEQVLRQNARDSRALAELQRIQEAQLAHSRDELASPTHEPMAVGDDARAPLATLLRRWSHYTDDASREKLRSTSATLLEELSDTSTLVISERDITLLEAGETEAATIAARDHLSMRPGATRLLYVLSRSQRELARKRQTRFDLSVEAELEQPIGQIGTQSETASLVSLLRFRSTASTYDGASWERTLTGRLTSLSEHLSYDQSGDRSLYRQWWGRQIEGILFPDSTRGDVTQVIQHLDERQREVDDLEEQYLDRLIAA